MTLTASAQLHRTLLPNGMVVLTQENPTADIIALRLFIRVGSRWESRDRAGLSHLVSAVLTKGTERLTSLEIAEQIESVGASLSTDTTPDYFLVSLKTVTADFEEMLQLTGEILRSPSFPESELELERRLTLQGIRSQREQPFNMAYDLLRQNMYQEHPYALSGLGTEDSVPTITRQDLVDYHQTYFRPDNMVLSLCGRITPETAMQLIERVFGDWRSPIAALPTLALPPIAPQPHRQALAQDTQQSIVMLGYFGPGVGAPDTTDPNFQNSPDLPNPMNPDYVALKLLNSYLGNGLSSRLFVELREKRGLAYDVSAFYPTRLDLAQFVVYMGTAPDNSATALEGLHQEIVRLTQQALGEEELQIAKNKILGQYALGKQTNGQIAQTYGWYETLGLGLDFDQAFQTALAAISRETIQASAQTYFGDPYVALVGPDSAVMPLV
jgi:zinc protease